MITQLILGSLAIILVGAGFVWLAGIADSKMGTTVPMKYALPLSIVIFTCLMILFW